MSEVYLIEGYVTAISQDKRSIQLEETDWYKFKENTIGTQFEEIHKWHYVRLEYKQHATDGGFIVRPIQEIEIDDALSHDFTGREVRDEIVYDEKEVKPTMSDSSFQGVVLAISKENYSFKVGETWYRTSTKTTGIKLADLEKGIEVIGTAKTAEKDGKTVNWVQTLEKSPAKAKPNGTPTGTPPSNGKPKEVASTQTPEEPASLKETDPPPPTELSAREKQDIISRLACINSSVEALKTHGKPITSKALLKFAGESLRWAMGEHEQGSE